MAMSNFMVLGLVALTFGAWVVALAGVASLQADCNDDGTVMVATASDVHPGTCSKFLRLQWFYIWFEFAALIAVAALSVGRVRARTASIGLLAVASILYIYGTNTFLNGLDALDGTSGSVLNRTRTAFAGFIMTAILNLILLIYLGLHEEFVATRPVAEKPVATTGPNAV